MTRLIGFRWTCGNVCSREVLIVRGLVIIFFVEKRIKLLLTKHQFDGCPIPQPSLKSIFFVSDFTPSS